MKIKLFIFIFCFNVFSKQDFVDTDFDQSMKVRPQIYPQDPYKLYLCKNLYDRNKFQINKAEDNFVIPPFCFHIWFGGQIPEFYKPLRETFFKNNPGFIFKLWGYDDLNFYNLDNKEQFYLAKTHGQRADIFKYEVVKNYGGGYYDCDFECFKSLEPFYKSHKFFSGISNEWLILIGAAAFAAVPGHRILSCAVNQLGQLKEQTFSDPNIAVTTGPNFFTRIIFEEINYSNDNVVLYPCGYFYPVTIMDNLQARKHVKMHMRPETYMAHYWDASWKKPLPKTSSSQSQHEFVVNTDVQKLMEEIFGDKFGTYLDVGASLQDSKAMQYFDMAKKWTGICFQPKYDEFIKIANSGRSFFVYAALKSDNPLEFAYNYDLKTIMDYCKLQKLDYINFNLKKPSAFLQGLDFDKLATKCISVRASCDQEAKKLLASKNYKYVKTIDAVDYFIRA